MNKAEALGERGIARQFVLGVVQTADGLPLMHTVHPGNVAETKTLQGMLQKVLQRLPIQRVVLVADRGLHSLDSCPAGGSVRARWATVNWARMQRAEIDRFARQPLHNKP